MDTNQREPSIEPPDDPKTLAGDFIPFLSRLDGLAGSPYVHPRVVSFNNAQHKGNWRHHLQDVEDRDTIRDFYTSPKKNRQCWIFLASAERVNWVTIGDEWKTEPWHCFAVAVIQDPAGGKHLIVFDPDPSAAAEPEAKPGEEEPREPRITTVLRGLQRTLYQWIRKEKTKNLRVWYSTDHRFEGQDKCLAHLLMRVREWASMGDQPWQGDGDPRASNCIQLTKV